MQPTICKQCGRNECAELWVICAACDKKNAEYEQKIDKQRRECREYSHSLSAVADRYQRSYYSKAHRGTKTRNNKAAAEDVEVDRRERNTRTDYHGGNFPDE